MNRSEKAPQMTADETGQNANSTALLEQLILDHLIPEFCADRARGCEASGFKRESIRVHEIDARNFMRAWHGGLIEHEGRGLYRAARSSASEQFFWSGARHGTPRSFTLWLEPIIAVAALAKLNFDHGWPGDLIGTQSPDWAFDVVSYHPDGDHEHIAGEVKKSASEIKSLLQLMRHFGQDATATIPPSGKARNAYKKVAALRERHAPYFWAIGPNGQSEVFRVSYCKHCSLDFVQADDQVLDFAEIASA